MPDCLFCKILKGDIPADKVYEDDMTLAFRDISPQAPTHILVIPKKHYSSVHEIPAAEMELMADVFATVQSVVAQESLAEAGYRLVINSGESSGQAVPHIHVHVLSGRELTWPPG